MTTQSEILRRAFWKTMQREEWQSKGQMNAVLYDAFWKEVHLLANKKIARMKKRARK